MRRHACADLLDRPVCRPRTTSLRLGDGRLEYRRRPPRLLLRGYRAMVEERLSGPQTDDAAVNARATGLLLYLQRARRHLPKHAACNRGLGPWRMETLRISLARGAAAHGLPDCCIWPSGLRQPDRPRRCDRGMLSTILREHGRSR